MRFAYCTLQTITPYALSTTTTPSVQLHYLHPDHLGTPRLATDSAQRVVWRWDSAPFGDTPAQEDPDGDGVKFTLNLRFPGQYLDAETGLHYNYFRDYDPVVGRYIESDPIGLRGGVNTYGYVGGNPLIKRDIFGLFSVNAGTCSQSQISEITLAAQIVLEKLLSGCGKCEDNGNCVPCEYVEGLKRAFQRVKIECKEQIDPKKKACAITADNMPLITLDRLAFTRQMPVGECGCLESVIYHELFHVRPEPGLDANQHPIIEGFVLRCFECARWHDPEEYPDYR